MCVGFSLFLMCSPSQDNYGSQCVSQPPTPSPLSPSPASLSSYQGDDSDSISSPAWPKNPSSPVSASCTFTIFSLLSCFSFFFCDYLDLLFDGVSCFDRRYDVIRLSHYDTLSTTSGYHKILIFSPISFQLYPVLGNLF